MNACVKATRVYDEFRTRYIISVGTEIFLTVFRPIERKQGRAAAWYSSSTRYTQKHEYE